MKKLFSVLHLFSWLGILPFSSCDQGPQGPEETFENYIQMRFDGEKSKQKILEYLTGTFEEKVKNMSDQEYRSFVQLETFEQNDFKVLSLKCDKKECFITYTLRYSQYQSEKKNKQDFASETRQTAILKQQADGAWKIANVEHIKTFHDMLNPLEAFSDKSSSKEDFNESGSKN